MFETKQQRTDFLAGVGFIIMLAAAVGAVVSYIGVVGLFQALLGLAIILGGWGALVVLGALILQWTERGK